MGRCRPVSDSEADAMEAHCDGPEELALIRFFRHTAYRSNETSSLVVSDLWDGHQVKDRVQIQAKHMKKRGFQASSDRSSSWLPLTQNLANRAMVRSTISLDFETMIDLRLKRPNQWRCRQWLRSIAYVVALLWTSLSGGMTDAYVAH